MDGLEEKELERKTKDIEGRGEKIIIKNQKMGEDKRRKEREKENEKRESRLVSGGLIRLEAVAGRTIDSGNSNCQFRSFQPTDGNRSWGARRSNSFEGHPF